MALKENLKEARFRRRERFLHNALLVGIPGGIALYLLGSYFYDDPVDIISNVFDIILWMPNLQIGDSGDQNVGHMALAFWKDPVIVTIVAALFTASYFIRLFFFGSISKGGVRQDIIAFLEGVQRLVFDRPKDGEESGFDYFGAFGVKERLERGMLYRTVKKKDYLERVSTPAVFTGDYSPINIFDDGPNRSAESHGHLIESMFKSVEDYHDLFLIIEGYLTINLGKENFVDTPLSRFQGFEAESRRTTFSARAMKDFIFMIESEAIRLIDGELFSMTTLSRDMYRYNRHNPVTLDDPITRERFLANIKFFAFLTFLRLFMGLPAGLIVVRVEDFELRRIVDLGDYLSSRNMTISIKDINDGGKRSKLDDRFPYMFFVFWNYLFRKSKKRRDFEMLFEKIDPLSSVTEERLDELITDLDPFFNRHEISEETRDEMYTKGKPIYEGGE